MRTVDQVMDMIEEIENLWPNTEERPNHIQEQIDELAKEVEDLFRMTNSDCYGGAE